MTDLATLLADGPWRLIYTGKKEPWIVTAPGLPLAKVEQEEAAAVLLSGAEIHRLAGAVQKLVQAVRRVVGIRLRFPTDSHFEPAIAALTLALEPWPVGGEDASQRRDAPVATEPGGDLISPPERGPSDASSAPATVPLTLQPIVFPMPAYQAPPGPASEPAGEVHAAGGAPEGLLDTLAERVLGRARYAGSTPAPRPCPCGEPLKLQSEKDRGTCIYCDRGLTPEERRLIAALSGGLPGLPRDRAIAQPDGDDGGAA